METTHVPAPVLAAVANGDLGPLSDYMRATASMDVPYDDPFDALAAGASALMAGFGSAVNVEVTRRDDGTYRWSPIMKPLP